MLTLTNITIQEREDKNLNKYYLIVDNNTDDAYFCFKQALKDGWQDLVEHYQEIKEVEIEFEVNERGNKKVVSLWSSGGIIV